MNEIGHVTRQCCHKTQYVLQDELNHFLHQVNVKERKKENVLEANETLAK
jgi:hypothetical protein